MKTVGCENRNFCGQVVRWVRVGYLGRSGQVAKGVGGSGVGGGCARGGREMEGANGGRESAHCAGSRGCSPPRCSDYNADKALAFPVDAQFRHFRKSAQKDSIVVAERPGSVGMVDARTSRTELCRMAWQ